LVVGLLEHTAVRLRLKAARARALYSGFDYPLTGVNRHPQWASPLPDGRINAVSQTATEISGHLKHRCTSAAALAIAFKGELL
jgi:hypothetical protein